MESDTREMCWAVRAVSRSCEPRLPGSPSKRLQTSSLGLSDHRILKEVGNFVVCTPGPVEAKGHDQRLTDVDPVGRWPAPAAGGSNVQEGDRSLRNLTFKPGKAEPMDDDNSHMAEATAYMAIAISKGLTPSRSAAAML